MNDETVHPAAVELENQLRRLEGITDPASRAIATDLVASVLQFHTAALERMLELIDGGGNAEAVRAAFDRDPLIRSVLLVHDLHPETFAARVQKALVELEPLLRKREATAELITAQGGLVRVRLKGGKGAGALAEIVEQAVRSAALEAVQVIVEEPEAARSGFVPLENLQSAPAVPAGANQK